MYGPSLQKEILATMASSSPKNNREFAAQSRPEGPKRSHSPQPELKSAEAQASERPRAKKKSGKSNWRQRKKSGKKGKSNWASFNSQRKICHGKQNETKDSTAESFKDSVHQKPSGRLVQRAVRAESPLPPKTQGVQTEPNFFLLTVLKLPDTAFENAESEIGSFLDDQEEQIFHDDLSSEDGFWSPKAYSI